MSRFKYLNTTKSPDEELLVQVLVEGLHETSPTGLHETSDKRLHENLKNLKTPFTLKGIPFTQEYMENALNELKERKLILEKRLKFDEKFIENNPNNSSISFRTQKNEEIKVALEFLERNIRAYEQAISESYPNENLTQTGGKRYKRKTKRTKRKNKSKKGKR